MPAGPPTIAWDVDDVLNDLTRAWLPTWRPHAPAVGYDALTENPPHRLLGAELPEYLASLDAFRQSPRYAALEPVPEVLAWFAAHGDGFRHLVLTAVPLSCAAASAAWVFAHFGRWVRAFHVLPSDRPGDDTPRFDTTKGDVLKHLGTAAVFVDDSPAQVRSARAAGVPAVLFPRPWNGNRGTAAEALAEVLAAVRS